MDTTGADAYLGMIIGIILGGTFGVVATTAVIVKMIEQNKKPKTLHDICTCLLCVLLLHPYSKQY